MTLWVSGGNDYARMPTVFVCYRREDSADVTGRIYDRLVAEFGAPQVMKDVDSIPLGVDFREHLDLMVAGCDVFVAVVGRDWDTSRLNDQKDYVRIEIESALAREIPVVPLFVRGGSMPAEQDLPESIRGFVYRNGVDVRADPDFHRDMDRVIEGLAGPERRTSPVPEPARSGGPAHEVDRSTQIPPAEPEPAPPSQGTPSPWSWVRGHLQVVVPVALAALALGVWALIPERSTSDPGVGTDGPGITAAPPAAEPAVEDAVTSPAAEPAALVAGDTFRDCPECPEMVVIPAGNFLIGSPDSEPGREADEGPQTRVTLADPLAMGRYEITVAEFAAFIAEGGVEPESDCLTFSAEDVNWRTPGFPQSGDHPVVCVNWNDARQYVAWLSNKTGRAYRLATEAEWEYAARADTTGERYGELDVIAWYASNSGETTYPVGQKEPNPFGLSDMLGNALEWTQSVYRPYPYATTDGREDVEVSDLRVVRGGSFDLSEYNVRAAVRLRNTPDDRHGSIGFRVVVSPFSSDSDR